MLLHQRIAQRLEKDGPVRVGLIGAGKFGSMFLAQAPTTPGLQVVAIADRDPSRARAACQAVGWDEERRAKTAILESGSDLIARSDVEVVIEATGNPAAGIAHALDCFNNGKHVVMVNVEADVLAGPHLAAEADRAGVVYSMAYGDQPALVAELVDWAHACGFPVVAAGKGSRYFDGAHHVTPDDVWRYYGLTPEAAAAAGMNPQMFNSFLDGTKSAIEMAAIANACGLTPPSEGLLFPPCGVDDLPRILCPKVDGGVLEAKGMVEVVASEERDGRPVFRDLRWGVYVVVEAPSAYAAACFGQYGVKTDPGGRYAAMYRPSHLIGLELNVSVFHAALLQSPTGCGRAFRGDVMAVAKRNLRSGEVLDGEGGYTVYGRVAPARRSLELDALPIGLAHGCTLKANVTKDRPLRWSDVEIETQSTAVRARRAAEALLQDA